MMRSNILKSWSCATTDLFSEDLDALSLGVPRGFVVVEEVSAEQDKVHAPLQGDVQDLPERVEGVAE